MVFCLPEGPAMFPSDPLELRGQDVAISVAHCAGAAPWTFFAFFH